MKNRVADILAQMDLDMSLFTGGNLRCRITN